MPKAIYTVRGNLARCSNCKKWKRFDAFALNKSRARGIQAVCKKCYVSIYKSKNPTHTRTIHLAKAYGLSWEAYTSLWEQQKGLCAICLQPITKVGTINLKDGAHVDHDHSTKEVRGLLCHNCNAGIGYLKDSETLLLSAIEYLRKYKKG